MSLCRWSSMNWHCDLYIYAAEDGFTTHVARNRRIGQWPELDFSSTERLAETHAAQHDALEAAPLSPIGGPYDGASFYGDTAEALLQRLATLRAAGYVFPDIVLEALRRDGDDA